MTITKNNNGSITISKPIHGNLMDIHKVTYYDYCLGDAKKAFKESFAIAESKTFINQP